MDLPNRIKELRVRAGLSQEALGVLSNTTGQQIGRLEKGERELTLQWMERLAKALSSVRPENVRPSDLLPEPSSAGLAQPAGEPHISSIGSRPQFTELFSGDDLPVYFSRSRGSNGMSVDKTKTVEHIPRPEPLRAVAGAYGLYFDYEDTMSPKYRMGDLLLIHPSRPARIDDHVIVYRRDKSQDSIATIGRLVERQSEGIVLEQYSPKSSIIIPVADIEAIHLIVGSYEIR